MNEKQSLQDSLKKALEEVGIKEGQKVLDFGCGRGRYTIPAARIVGEKGIVYALDKDKGDLDELMQKAEAEGFGNIIRIDTSGDIKIPLDNESIDVVLLYDVLHHYYFPHIYERKKVLEEVYRVAKPKGLISVYPKHMEPEEIKDEIESANFLLENRYSLTLVHEERPEEARVMNFRKKR